MYIGLIIGRRIVALEDLVVPSATSGVTGACIASLFSSGNGGVADAAGADKVAVGVALSEAVAAVSAADDSGAGATDRALTGAVEAVELGPESRAVIFCAP